MLDTTRFRHRGGHVDCGRQRFDPGRGANSFRVVHAILQAEKERLRREKRRQFLRRRFRVGGLDAEENQLGAARRAELGSGFHAQGFVKLQSVELQPALLHRIGELRPSDEDHRRARARQHATEIAAHGPRADDGNSRPFLCFGHGKEILPRLVRARRGFPSDSG